MAHTLEQRRRIVRDTIEEHGGRWPLGMVQAIAAQCGCERQTIHRDKRAILAELSASPPSPDGRPTPQLPEPGEDRETRRRRFLEELQADIESARRASSYGAIASLLRIRVQVDGLDVPPPEQHQAEDDDEPEDDLDAAQRHLRAVRQARQDALARGSMVAAVQLLEAESRSLEVVRTLQRERDEAAEMETPTEETVAAIVEGITTLPPMLQDQIRSALWPHLAPDIDTDA